MRNKIAAAPVSQQERIIILDSLRGIAILGILLMNIPSFGLARNVSHDPSVYNEQGINYTLWYLVNWIPDGTQRALFSMLFGAGIILFTSRLEKKLPGASPLDYFIQRQVWLMVFSLFDVFGLLWNGDILLDYACLGLIMVAFRKLPGKALLVGAGVCFIFMLARENRDFYQDKKGIYRGEAAARVDTTVTKLTDRQKDELAAMTDYKQRSTHEIKVKRAEKSIVQATGSYEDVYEYRTGRYIEDIVPYLYFGLWDVLLFMFIGMAFFKLGILTGQASQKIYWIMFIAGTTLGLLFSYLRLKYVIDYNFNWFEYTKHVKFQFYELSRTCRSIGIFALIMLLYKSGWCKWLFSLMQPVGQMAFTNYLMQSFLCGMFFNGIGLGMYGKLQRYEIYLVVVAVWVVQIVYSHVWLQYYRFGPMEWAWRSLTYWKRQPMKRNVITPEMIATA
jgi:uncharacterized protein